MKSGVALFGEILVDLVVGRDMSLRAHEGGSLFNTAASLVRLGVPVTLYSDIGKDLWGDFLAEKAESFGVDTKTLARGRNGKTMLAFATTDLQGNARYDFYRSPIDADFDFSALGNSRVFHFGSILSILPDAESAVRKALKAARGNLISYDPNFRPAYKSRSRSYLRNMKSADIVKASYDDVAGVFDLDGVDAAMEALRGCGASLLILTLGAEGAIAQTRAGPTVRVASPTVSVRTTIGAGDNFSAGYLAFLHERGIEKRSELEALGESDLREMLEFAQAVAREALKVEGAIPENLDALAKILRSARSRPEARESS